MVNNGIHQLLRGALAPQGIQEEDIEASHSIAYQNNCSFDQMSLVAKNVLSNNNIALNNSGYSSLIDGKKYTE